MFYWKDVVNCINKGIGFGFILKIVEFYYVF